MNEPEPPRRHNLVATKNRFLAALCHVNRYSGQFSGLLARDTGISHRTLGRILRGETEPHYGAAIRIAEVISRFSGVDIPLEELIVTGDRDFPTKYVCDLFSCKCRPPWAWTRTGLMRPEFEGIPPGEWSLIVSTKNPYSPNSTFDV